MSGLLSEMREAGQVDIVAVNTLMKAYVNKVRSYRHTHRHTWLYWYVHRG